MVLGDHLRVLINAIGIQDSGGIVVLEKLLNELLIDNKDHTFLFFISKNIQTNVLIKKYNKYKNFEFKSIAIKGYLDRLLYENIFFRKYVKKYKIDLIYNFSGTNQFFIKIPKLIKVQNLLFYSQKLDKYYKKKSKYFLWIKQILLKRQLFKFMLLNASFIEIQSKHVQRYLSEYINLASKTFFIKSDIDSNDYSFKAPCKYNFSKRVKILFIVGPHFENLNKNFSDFKDAMLKLKEAGVNFEINITLTKEELNASSLWDRSLNSITKFHGYLKDQKEIDRLYSDNTILISTSVIESIGLHVVDAIKKGVLFIAPGETYAKEVYGDFSFSYILFDPNSLFETLKEILNEKNNINDFIRLNQKNLKINESEKFENILDIFNKVIKG